MFRKFSASAPPHRVVGLRAVSARTMTARSGLWFRAAPRLGAAVEGAGVAGDPGVDGVVRRRRLGLAIAAATRAWNGDFRGGFAGEGHVERERDAQRDRCR